MVFHPPSWVPKLPFDPPGSIPIHEFWGDERHGRLPFDRSRNPFTCGLTGKTYTNREVASRVNHLARALSKRLGWRVNDDTPWDKVLNVYSLNSIDYVTASFAVHRLNGISTPANAMYSASELEYQLKTSGAKAIITCVPLLETALKAAKTAGISEDRIFLMDVAGFSAPKDAKFKTLGQLIEEGQEEPELPPVSWTVGQGARQVAFLCFSSGTSGLPKAVMIAHRNVIANLMQLRWHEEPGRRAKGIETQAQMGLLPMSHIYGLVVIALGAMYRGDGTVVLPKFELQTLLKCVQQYKVNFMHLVPPIIIQLLKNPEVCSKYDLSSLQFIYTGAAPLGGETHEAVERSFPGVKVGQGYGMTETSTLVISSGQNDVMVGTSGSLVPATRAKLLDEEGHEITKCDKRGELLIQSPSVTLGYLNNERATTEAFIHDEDGRWMRTGDVAVAIRAPSGNIHLAIVDRLKELIKVKGNQVAPAELEAHLLTHPAVADCTVIPVPDESAGEVPKAFVVKAKSFADKPDAEVAREIAKHVEDHKARYKWLKGGIEFISEVPKSPSGKILRRMLRDKEREARRAKGAKL
ncbi:uncharacterized protein B0I36DRAFT_62996 [Microdochium trichocladiopsis]|uniref:Uncharacterized protein n=1 Tax=Microdochium trichocladiopsis TaxID=1682393 RepID=A0A9P8YD16_9PEZI|nr:uncharacterized protein B0I36DRAFT_62996 [Microdochium trichocladiopsis]KAH7037220.1 hypothetical protein B0I36DRAFT_62996 [Microdochium trichocladiopsis]